MATLSNTFEGGTPGTAVTTANSGGASGNAFDFVDPSSSTITYTATALHGAVACSLAAATSDDPYFEWQTGISGTSTWGRVYLRISSLPPSNINLVRHLAGTATVITVRINTNGRLGLLYGTGTFASNGTVAIPLDTWVRLEWAVTTGTATGSVTAWLYTTPESTTAADTLSATNVNTGTASAVTRQRMGMLSSGIWSLLFDSVAFSDTAKIGPAGGGGPVTANATDSLVLADTTARSVARARAASDTLTQADAATRTVSASRGAGDGLSLGDGAVAVVTRARTASDTVTVGDAVTRTVTTARTAADTLSLGDVVSPSSGVAAAASDMLALTDAAVRAVTVARTGSDRQIPGDGSNLDSLDLDDTATRTRTATRAAAESLHLADEAAATVGQALAAVDGLALADAAARAATFGRVATDGLLLADTATRATSVQRAASDVLAAADTATAATGQTAAAADTLALTDAADRTATHARAAADGVFLADDAARTVTAERAVADTLTLVHDVTTPGSEPPAGRGTPTVTGYPAAVLVDRPGAETTSYGSEVTLL